MAKKQTVAEIKQIGKEAIEFNNKVNAVLQILKDLSIDDQLKVIHATLGRMTDNIKVNDFEVIKKGSDFEIKK